MPEGNCFFFAILNLDSNSHRYRADLSCSVKYSGKITALVIKDNLFSPNKATICFENAKNLKNFQQNGQIVEAGKAFSIYYSHYGMSVFLLEVCFLTFKTVSLSDAESSQLLCREKESRSASFSPSLFGPAPRPAGL